MGGLCTSIANWWRSSRQQPPQDLQAIINEYKLKIQEAQKFGRLSKDPKKYKQFSEVAFQNFIEKLKQAQYPELLINQNKQCVKLLVGGISCGKSSLINSYFDKMLEVGIGQTTKESTLAHRQDDNGIEVLIFDTPGECETFNTQNLDTVGSIAQSNQVFILYNTSLKRIEQMIRAIAAIKPNYTVLLRTQCDRFQQTFNRTLEEEIEEDKKILKKWGIGHIQICMTSAVLKEGFDNRRVMTMMKSQIRKETDSRPM